MGTADLRPSNAEQRVPLLNPAAEAEQKSGATCGRVCHMYSPASTAAVANPQAAVPTYVRSALRISY